MTTGACVLKHKHQPERLRRVLDGLLVCGGCLGRIEQVIAEAPARYDELAKHLTPKATPGEIVTGTKSRPLPIDVEVADHRADMLSILRTQAGAIADMREVAPPKDQSVRGVAGFLLVHLRWAAARDVIESLSTDMAHIEGKTWALLQPSGRRRVEVGACIEDGCDGILTATIAPTDDLLPSAITCSHNGEHEWEAHRWVALGRRIHGAASVDPVQAVVMSRRIAG
jgi:hypothetical protein